MDLSHQEDDGKKSCSMCGTEKTPLWRSGPAGPKSLCNACGIKHRKRSIVICKTNKNKPSKTIADQAGSSTSTETWSKSKPKLDKPSSTNLKQSVKAGLTAFGKDMVRLQKQRSFKRRQRSEEVEAAVLLMSLSCGSVFA